MTRATPKPAPNPVDHAQEVHLSPTDLSARLGIPVATLYRWRLHGDGPRAMTIGKHLRFRLSDVLAWEESQLDGR